MHRKLIREIINRNDTAIMQELETIVLEMMDELKITDKKKYKDIEYKRNNSYDILLESNLFKF